MSRIVLVEDHTLVRSGIRLLLERARDLQIVGEAEDGRQAVELVKELSPDLAVLDVGMPNLNGLDAARQIREQRPQTRVLMLSMHADVEYVREAFRVGATGYVLKNAATAELEEAIHAVLDGQVYVSAQLQSALSNTRPGTRHGRDDSAISILTGREREVLQLISEGNAGPEIARVLAISERTVETHRQNVMAKLHIHSIAGLTRFALRYGLTALDT